MAEPQRTKIVLEINHRRFVAAGVYLSERLTK